MELKQRLLDTVNRIRLDIAELEQSYRELRERGGPEKKEGEEGFEHYAKYYNLSLAVLMVMDKLKTESKILIKVIQELI